MNKHKHYNVIMAWAEGKLVQRYDESTQTWGTWRRPDAPSFCEYQKWRVKPEDLVVEYWPEPAITEHLVSRGIAVPVLNVTICEETGKLKAVEVV